MSAANPRFNPADVPLTLEQRQARNVALTRINNSDLYAGSPMYYYCRLCGNQMILPESHIERAPWYCSACIHDGLAVNSHTRAKT